MILSENDIESQIEKWLKAQGYPLEMYVASIFNSQGFRVRQSTFYHDPETDLPREIDVVATKGLFIGEDYAHIIFVIECKVSKKKPWIIFTRENKINDWEYTGWYCSTEKGSDYIIYASIDGKFENLPLTFHQRERVGYGLTQAFVSGEDLVYKAMQSAGRCAVSYVKKGNSFYTGTVDIIIPVIVIDGCLFESYIDDNNELITKSIQEGVVLWDIIIADRKSLAIHIITRDYVEAFAKKASATADILIKDWEINLSEIMKETSGYMKEFNNRCRIRRSAKRSHKGRGRKKRP